MTTQMTPPPSSVEVQPDPGPEPKKPRRRTLRTWLILLAILALLVAGMGAGWLVWGQQSEETPNQPAATASGAEQGGTVATLPSSTEPAAAVAEALLPTVVQIQTSQGLGSGVIYDAGGGLILTAAHVVDGEREVMVRLADGDQISGQVVGVDDHNDVAVVKIDHGGLSAAPLAVDQKLQVAETAIALGSPFGLEQTVTVGVVSATERAVPGADGVVRVAIQTDAPINPGNSGGPLANLQGQVIGINDAIFSRSGGNEGVGFAIPITQAKEAADRIVAGDQVNPGFLGITGTEPTQGESGSLVTGVLPGSPADDAGIEVGDLLTAVDGHRVESTVDLAAQVQTHQAGDQVVITLVRSGSSKDVDVTLGSAG